MLIISSLSNIIHQRYILNAQTCYLVSSQALIELLDQVEDVISVESSLSKDDESHLDPERCPKADPVVRRSTANSEENRSTADSNLNFLVLEVCTNTFLHINSSCMGYEVSLVTVYLP